MSHLVYAMLQLFGHALMLAFYMAFSVVGVTLKNPLVVICMILSHIIALLSLTRPIFLLASRYANN